MGREVRIVPPTWEHPKQKNGRHAPLFGRGFADELKEWETGKAKWDEGFRDNWEGGWVAREGDELNMTFADWHGRQPIAEDYMPEAEATHLMMYENCSEGTPISPAFDAPEKLARWLADNGASSFGSMTASYEQWLNTCKTGFAFSAVSINGEFKSGVEAGL